MLCLIHKGSSKRSCKIATKIYAWSWTLFITTFLWIHVITLHYFSSKITLTSSIRCVWRKVIFLPVIYTCLILSSNLQDTKSFKGITKLTFLKPCIDNIIWHKDSLRPFYFLWLIKNICACYLASNNVYLVLMKEFL